MTNIVRNNARLIRHLVGRHLLGSQSLAKKRQHNHHASKRCHHNEQGRRQREDGKTARGFGARRRFVSCSPPWPRSRVSDGAHPRDADVRRLTRQAKHGYTHACMTGFHRPRTSRSTSMAARADQDTTCVHAMISSRSARTRGVARCCSGREQHGRGIRPSTVSRLFRIGRLFPAVPIRSAVVPRMKHFPRNGDHHRHACVDPRGPLPSILHDRRAPHRKQSAADRRPARRPEAPRSSASTIPSADTIRTTLSHISMDDLFIPSCR
jgi:hypothetical protein